MGKIDEFLVHKLLYPDPVPILNSSCSVWFRPWCQRSYSLTSFCLYFCFRPACLWSCRVTHSSLCALTHGAALHALLFFLLLRVSVGVRAAHPCPWYRLRLLLSCRWFLIITLCHTPNFAFLTVVFIIRIYFGPAYPRRSLELYGAIGSQIFDSSLGPLWSHILGIMLLLAFFIILWSTFSYGNT